MWTEITREQYRREGLRYASDMTDAEWAMGEPLMPAAKRLGRPRKVELRGVCREPALHPENGLSLASVAARFSKPLVGAALLLCLANRWTMGTDQFRPAPAGPRTGWPRGEPLGRGDRQPVGQDH